MVSDSGQPFSSRPRMTAATVPSIEHASSTCKLNVVFESFHTIDKLLVNLEGHLTSNSYLYMTMFLIVVYMTL